VLDWGEYMKKMNIAIDGPAGAGKSTVAKRVADELTYAYIDTGAMYRALTWKALQKDVDVSSEADLTALLQTIDMQISPSKHGQKVYVNQVDVTEEIRKRNVTNQVSQVASHPHVRKSMLDLQRQLAQKGGVVMDGRDIGTHVLPDAEVKVFLSATIEERARRRYLELKEKGQEQDFEELKEEIRTRDERDSNREVAPLQKANDALEVDTTGLTIEQVVAEIIHIIKERS
jgi:cytidylate kinase